MRTPPGRAEAAPDRERTRRLPARRRGRDSHNGPVSDRDRPEATRSAVTVSSLTALDGRCPSRLPSTLCQRSSESRRIVMCRSLILIAVERVEPASLPRSFHGAVVVNGTHPGDRSPAGIPSRIARTAITVPVRPAPPPGPPSHRRSDRCTRPGQNGRDAIRHLGRHGVDPYEMRTSRSGGPVWLSAVGRSLSTDSGSARKHDHATAVPPVDSSHRFDFASPGHHSGLRG